MDRTMQRIDQRHSAHRLSRRDFVKAGVAASALLPMPAIAQGAAGRVVVIGGGFAGGSAARALKKLDPRLTVTLVEESNTFTACPFSNLVIAGIGRSAEAATAALTKSRRLRR